MQGEATVSPPRHLSRRSLPSSSSVPRSGSRLRTLLGLNQPQPEPRSDLHDTLYIVPRQAADAHDMRVFENVARMYEGGSRSYDTCENGRVLTPTPDPGCSGGMGMGRGLLPRLLEMITTPKRKGKSKIVYDIDGELLPLDGEEGELIDDEACFMEPNDSDGIDLLVMLPPELALYILSQLDLDSVVACLAVSHAWRRLASDDTVWRTLFYRQSGWFVNIPRRQAQILASQTLPAQSSQSRSPSLLSSLAPSSRRTSAEPTRPPANLSQGEFSLNWPDLFRQRHKVARKWYFGAAKSNKLAGHLDSVYCLELDTAADTIVTGSRDRSIKIWSGFMCSGSSDRTIRVWERAAGSWGVKAVLSGHAGGVLDLRIDDKWIVSCSKDTFIRVWDRQTLQQHCVLKGHEGLSTLSAFKVTKSLVQAEMDDTIISGSNDRKIKVWSASTGDCLFTLPGHELLVRALAYDSVSRRLVSASYDRTIKVWEFGEGRQDGWKLVREFKNLHDSHIFDVKFDATKIVSTSHDQKILVLDFAYDVDALLFT
ncbi:F-box and WD-40 domain protein [Rhizoctonia solani]|uniref:F-box and WD-40 domain protein n=1 Tax=Rhizoctonia solani TaxID=456999 RepID=A0A8H8P8U7_9AGAM|nr:F-box and WD-40 domain protein [Rhizoctonia solani]QRW25928.1 F-box and WD-40 domain protein [Rhizoctonia solani]